MTRVERNAPCKINLLLNILGKRPDGFHELETVMQRVGLSDTLLIERSGGASIELTCSSAQLPVDSSNLVYRAAEAFLTHYGRREGLRIHLEKRIPMAAGLGGGSGNAAATLLALNELFDKPLPVEDLHSIAAQLGSDVPFFLQPFPALATGRGELVRPLEYLPALQNVHVLLIHPGFGVSTPWAYRALAEFPEALQGRPGRAQELIGALREPELSRAAPLFFNALEMPVLRKYPLLELFQEFLRENGAVAARMSGSGSTTFGLFTTEKLASECLGRFKARFGSSAWTAVVPLT